MSHMLHASHKCKRRAKQKMNAVNSSGDRLPLAKLLAAAFAGITTDAERGGPKERITMQRVFRTLRSAPPKEKAQQKRRREGV